MKWWTFLKGPNKRAIIGLLSRPRLAGRMAGKQPLRSSCLPATTTWSFAICGSHLLSDTLGKCSCAAGSAACVSSALMEWCRSLPSYLIPTCHWVVIWKLNHIPGWWPGAGACSPLFYLSIYTCLLTDKLKCSHCIAQIIQQILEIYFNDWLEKSMLYTED